MTNQEIDVMVAEVMGGIFPDDPDEFSDKGEVWFYIKKGKILVGNPYQIRGTILFDHSWEEWEPTENIAQAWQVWEWLENSQTSGGKLVLGRDDNHNPAVLDCFFYSDDNGGNGWEIEIYSTAESYCLAICLAALKAVKLKW